MDRLTILVGPQASGKSILSKLAYFFLNIVFGGYSPVEEPRGLDELKSKICRDFSEWFPPSAWGLKVFSISFGVGDFEILITNSRSKKQQKGRQEPKLTVTFSESFEQEYGNFVKSLVEKSAGATGEKIEFERKLQHLWRAEQLYERRVAKRLGDDFVKYQLFVPAGRSFFTSMGKAIAAFEQSRLLDPITIEFGRIFTAYRERPLLGWVVPENAHPAINKDLTAQLFGGEFKFTRGNEYLLTEDGRQVPFQALSSGQQELLPLWLMLEYWARPDRDRQLIYIEEPEAHLFPSAQNLLVETLARIAGPEDNKIGMVLTTHSPYVLAKINNLIKAGVIASEFPNLGTAVSAVVPREAWLGKSVVSAYALQDGALEVIVDEDGLIDGSYLDKISGEIAREFSELLEIEASTLSGKRAHRR